MKCGWDVMSWSRGIECLLSFVLCDERAGGVCTARGKYGAVDIEATTKYELDDRVM